MQTRFAFGSVSIRLQLIRFFAIFSIPLFFPFYVRDASVAVPSFFSRHFNRHFLASFLFSGEKLPLMPRLRLWVRAMDRDWRNESYFQKITGYKNKTKQTRNHPCEEGGKTRNDTERILCLLFQNRIQFYVLCDIEKKNWLFLSSSLTVFLSKRKSQRH